MKISNIFLSVALLVSGFSFAAKAATTVDIPKEELRSAWLPTILTGTSWPGSVKGTTAAIATQQKDLLIKHIERMVHFNCNALSLQVRPMGDALYKSSCEPWSHYLTGTRGAAPTYDPLEFFVKECHDRGIEAHAWINPFRLKSGGTPMTDYDNAHVSKGWTLTYNNITIFDPGNPEVRKYIVDRVMEVVKNYDVDGIMFDDYFYCPGIPSDITSGYDYDEYKASGTKLSLADWRRENVNKMIAETHAAIKAVKPWVRFGLSPRGIGGGPGGVSAKKYGLPACPASAGDGMYNSIFCDPLVWMNEKTIDYISPQIYWATTQSNAPYDKICNWWVKVSDKMDVAFYSSVGAYRGYSAGEMTTELNLNRSENHDGDNGVVFYAAADMDQYESEIAAAMATKALVPPLRAYSPKNPGKIASLKLDGNKLSCSAIDGMRYVFYAIPTSVTKDQASNKAKTGFNAEYILDFSYTPSYTLPKEKIGGFWYAVTPYDRYGYEWDATTYGLDDRTPGEVPTLVAPDNGTIFTEGDVIMTVGKIATAASQSVQIASDKAFNDVIISVTEPTAASGNNLQFILPVSYFADGTYYWRSLASYEKYSEGISEVRTFTIKRNSGSQYTIITDGVLYDFTDPNASGRQLRLQNLWVRSDIHGNSLDLANKHCRDFTVIDNTIYVANMDGVSSTAAFRLLRYDAQTGKDMASLELTPDANYNGFYAPLTTVTTDDAGNLLIAGMALSSNNKMVVGKVNTVDGKITTLAKLPVVARIDHIDAVGDLTKDGYVIAASATTTDAYRWHIKNGEVVESKTYGLGKTPGTAPRIFAVSANGAFIDGSSTPFEYYRFGDGKATGTFSDSKAVQVNGGTYFVFDGIPMLIYPSADYPKGIVYSIDYGKSLPTSYAGLTNLWTITPKTFGSTSPAGGDFGAPVEVRLTNGDFPAAHIYTYAANNALAAYKMDYATSTGGVDDVTDSFGIHPTMNDGVLNLGTVVDNVEVYTTSGMQVAAAANTATVNLKGNTGLLIVKVTVDGKQKSIKIIL